jgi:hypothetical protein
VLTESLLLSAAGALLGVFLACFGADALVRIMASGRPIIGLPPRIEIHVHPDAHVLLFTGPRASLFSCDSRGSVNRAKSTRLLPSRDRQGAVSPKQLST